ncbi:MULTISPECIES: thioredoxin family protein [Cohaesibacter]|uniref:thioredoxin family protein n=1 Tax=Cohaesibacter TaxID=655352 RepID=UPI000DEAF284|nr:MULTISPECIES: thioredoxin family protein [Cohaesibacter]TLP48343.1 thioredoxin family protein [Cohaesibacter sp. CAU 1516]
MIRFFALLSFLVMTSVASASDVMDYKPGLIQSLLKEGKTVFVDYKASWCTTCAAQERVIERLRSENDVYDKALTFVAVDWDNYRDHEVTTSRNIPRRSTLLVLKGDQELGRIVAGTSTKEIKALLDKGL